MICKEDKLPKLWTKLLRHYTRWMCDNFYDIRTFGAVMSTEVNCGQVRGPVQLNFSKSVEPVFPLEVSITRMAVTNERDLEKERTFGRKHIVPYGMYRAEGYISAHLAQQTGFMEDDLSLLWEALINMYDHDHSSARGKMNARKLFVFKHDSSLGNAPAHVLFDLIKTDRVNDSSLPARGFEDYSISFNKEKVPKGIEVIERL